MQFKNNTASPTLCFTDYSCFYFYFSRSQQLQLHDREVDCKLSLQAFCGKHQKWLFLTRLRPDPVQQQHFKVLNNRKSSTFSAGAPIATPPRFDRQIQKTPLLTVGSYVRRVVLTLQSWNNNGRKPSHRDTSEFKLFVLQLSLRPQDPDVWFT